MKLVQISANANNRTSKKKKIDRKINKMATECLHGDEKFMVHSYIWTQTHFFQTIRNKYCAFSSLNPLSIFFLLRASLWWRIQKLNTFAVSLHFS